MPQAGVDFNHLKTKEILMLDALARYVLRPLISFDLMEC